MGGLGTEVLSLGVDLSAFNKGLDQAHQKAIGAGKNMLGAIAGAAGIGGIGAALYGGVKAAGDLQQAVANISTINPTINTDEVTSALNKMSTRVPQDAKQLADGLYNVFSSVQVTQEEGLRLTEEFARSAVGAGTDAETFGTAAMGVMNAYGLSVKDAAHISDVFFNTVNAGVVTGPELAASLGPVTASAKAAGVDIDHLGALIAGVTKEGGPAAQNINNLNNTLMKLSGPSKESAAYMKEMGINMFDTNGKARDIMDVFGDMKGKMSDMTEAQKANFMQQIFPDAQARQGAQTIISQLDFVNDTLDTNVHKTGAARAAFEKMNGTFNSQAALLKNTAISIGIELGAKLLPKITPLVTWLKDKLPEAVDFLGAKFNEFWPKIEPIVLWLGEKIPLAFTFMQKAFTDAWAIAEPVLLNLQEKLTATNGPMQAVKDAAMGIWDTFKKAWPGIKRAVIEAWDYIKPKVIEMHNKIMEFVTEVAPKVQKAVATMVNWITEHWATISAVTKAVFDGLNAIVQTALAVVKTTVKVWLDIFNGDWDKVWADVNEGFRGIWNAWGPFVNDVWNGIVGFVTSGVNAVIRKINEMINAVNEVTHMHIPNISELGDNSSDGDGQGGSIGQHAMGGLWPANTWSWVGEKGKELVKLGRQDAFVYTHEQSMALAGSAMSGGGGGGGPTIVNVYLGSKLIASEIRKDDRAYVRRNAGA